MDSERPLKRSRAHTNEAQTVQPPPSAAQLGQMLSVLKPDAQLQLLVAAATAHPDVAAQVAAAHALQLSREAAVIISFDHYSKAAWRELNPRYQMSGSAEYEASFDAAASIEGMLDTIVDRTKRHSSYGTKFNAIETFRKIFKSLLLSTGVIPHEVRTTHYGWGERFISVLQTFDQGELEKIAGNAEWMGKLDELAELARSFALDDLGIDDALDIITGEAEEHEEQDEVEDEEEV